MPAGLDAARSRRSMAFASRLSLVFHHLGGGLLGEGLLGEGQLGEGLLGEGLLG